MTKFGVIKHKHNTLLKEDGFTLLNVLVGLVILSVLMTPYFMVQNIELKRESKQKSEEEVQTVYDAIIQFARENQRYPRPADPTLAPIPANAATYGTEVGPVPPGAPGTLPAPFTTMVVGGVDGSGNPRRVIIGSVPFTTLGIPQHLGIDQFGNKLTYAVTEVLTNPGGLVPNDGNGAISLQNQYTNDPALLALKAPPNGTNHIRVPVFPGAPLAQFAIVGHGRNGVGAFTSAGTQPIPCGGPNIGMENENCDGDAVFLAMEDMGINTPILAAPNDDRRQRIMDSFSVNGTQTTNATYFDDLIRVETSFFNGRAWTLLDDPAVANAIDATGAALPTTIALGSTQNTNLTGRGRVLVVNGGTPARQPRGLLDVEGNVRTNSEVEAESICNESSAQVGTRTRCYKPSDITDNSLNPPINCGPGIRMGRIAPVNDGSDAPDNGGAGALCNPFFTLPQALDGDKACPPGQRGVGVNVVNGELTMVCQ